MSSECETWTVPAEIVGRLRSFLEKAIAQPAPPRDVPAATALGESLVELFDAAPDWTAAEAAVASALAANLADRPGDWTAACELVNVHFRIVFVDPTHPRAQRSTAATAGGRQLSPVQLNLLPPLVHALLAGAAVPTRQSFYATIRELELWESTALALAQLDVSAEEMTTFLDAIQKAGAMLAGGLVTGLGSWAARDIDRAKGVAETWSKRPAASQGDGTLLVLAHAIAAAPSGTTWRDSIVERLLASMDEGLWGIAIRIQCFAWPSDASARERHAAMMSIIRRAPSRLARDGLVALWRDAYTCPIESLDTTHEIVTLAAAPPPRDKDLIRGVVKVVVSALLGNRLRDLDVPRHVLPALERLFPTLLELEPPGDQRDLDLDSILNALMGLDRPRAFRFLAEWLERHAPAIVRRGVSLAELLPQVARTLGPDDETRYLIVLLNTASPALRASAAALLGRAMREIGEDAYAEVPSKMAPALAHELAAARGMLGVQTVGAVYRLARCHELALATVLEIVLDDLLPNYPARCEEALAIWDGLEAKPHFAQARGAIEQRLASMKAAYAARRAIPEIVQVRPAETAWFKAEQEIADRSFRETRKKSIWASLMSTFVVGRGKQIRMTPHSTPNQFVEHSSSIELPQREAVDPLGEIMRRAAHGRAAESLRRAAEGPVR